MRDTSKALSTQEASKRLGCSCWLVRKYARKGLLRSQKRGQIWYFFADDIQAFQEERQREHKKETTNAPSGLSGLKWFSISTGLISMVFLFLSTLPDTTAMSEKLQVQVLREHHVAITNRMSLSEVVMAAASPSAVHLDAGLQFFSPTPAIAIDTTEKQNVGNTKGTADTASSYLAGWHGTPGLAAIITDAELLHSHPFFIDAANGDKLFFYQTKRKALLFRPTTNTIIAFGSLDDIPLAFSQEEQKPVVAIRNGRSGKPYDKKIIEDGITSVLKDPFIIVSDDARLVYAKTTVVIVGENMRRKGEDIAKKLRATVTSLSPEELPFPPGIDILIFVGNDQK